MAGTGKEGFGRMLRRVAAPAAAPALAAAVCGAALAQPAAGPGSPPPPPGGSYQIVALGGDRVAQVDGRDGRVRVCRLDGSTLDSRATVVCSQWSPPGGGGR